MSEPEKTVRLRVSPEVARIVVKGAPRDLQLTAARGVLPLSGHDLVTALFFLIHGGDPEIRAQSLTTLKGIAAATLAPIAGNPDNPPQLLDFLARVRLHDPAVMQPLLANRSLPTATVAKMAAVADGPILSLIVSLIAADARLAGSPEVAAAIIANPRADRALKLRLGWREPEPEPAASAAEAAEAAEEEENVSESEEADGEENEAGETEEINQSKYQQSLQMDVASKIKMALTGDKEWRNIFIKDANKLVSSAVMKNPRITEGEVQTIAKSRSSSEELIRLITANREWVKNYEIQRALVMHPRTPLPKALRYMAILSEKDIKTLAKSRNVSQVIANNARRMLTAKLKKNK